MLLYRYPDQPTNTTPDFIRGLQEDEWLAQGKYDGHRCGICTDICLPRESSEGLRLLSRHAKPLVDSRLPQLKAFVSQMDLPSGCFIDSEFVGPRGQHQPSLYIFDCLAWEGRWLDKIPFQGRWQLCCEEIAQRIPEGSNIFLAETITTDFLDYFTRLAKAWDEGGRQLDLFEGIVVKRKSGFMHLNFNSGHKSGNLFKIRFRDIRNARNWSMI